MATRLAMAATPWGLWAKSTRTLTPPISRIDAAAGIVGLVGAERAQGLGHGGDGQAQGGSTGDGGQGVGEVVAGGTGHADADLGGGEDRDRARRRGAGRAGPSSSAAPSRMPWAGAMVNQASGAPRGSCALDQARIVGVEDQGAAMQRLGDDELGVGDAVRVLDAVLAQMVGGDVGDDGGIGAGHGQAAAQDAAAGELQHRDLDPGVAQDEARAAGAGIVAPVQDLVADPDPVAGAEAGGLAGGAGHGGEQADGGRLAVGAGDQDQRDVVDRGPVDLLGVRQLVVVPAERARAEADRDPAVALDEGDAAAGGLVGQRHQGGLAVLGDLAADAGGRGFEWRQRRRPRARPPPPRRPTR